jgi:hypothetical protein
MKKSRSKGAESPSTLIDARIDELGDWRGQMLSRLRALVRGADPEVAEEWKWRGVPVWSHDGLICTGETYTSVVKMTFVKGASLKDPSGLFNASLDGNVRRAIDFHEGDTVDEEALKALVRAAVALNRSSARGRRGQRGSTTSARPRAGKDMVVSQLFRFPGSVRRDPAIEAWMREHTGELETIARRWFAVMRDCGDDVRELLHDGHPTACVGDAAFGYVNAFTAHVNVGFFRGADMADPKGLLEGTGRFMRHVKLRPEQHVDAEALRALVEAAYRDMKRRMEAG